MIGPFNYVRIEGLSPRISLGNPMANATRLLTYLNHYGHAASETPVPDVLVLPELYLTGYTCADMFHNASLYHQTMAALEYLLNETRKVLSILILGVPIFHEQRLFNTAVVIHRGNILGIVPKTYLPNQDEFYESRWFRSSTELMQKEIQLFDALVPFNPNLLFEDADSELVIGVEICEDLWAPIPQSTYHALSGANVIANLSASNWYLTKREYRRQLIGNQSARCYCAMVYVSSGIGESTTDTVFDGHVLIASNGAFLGETFMDSHHSHDEEWASVSREIDLEALTFDRMHHPNFKSIHPIPPATVVTFYKEGWMKNTLTNPPSMHPFIPKHESLKRQRCQEILEIQSSALAERCVKIGCEKLILGLSGGLDSTLAFLVCIQTLTWMKKSVEDCLTYYLPGFGSSVKTQTNAIRLSSTLSTACRIIPIEEIATLHLHQLDHPDSQLDITFENVQARLRTLFLMNKANQQKGLVVGTGDLSEIALGWSTYNGDHMSMYHVNAGIPKTLIQYVIATALEIDPFSKAKDVLLDILQTPISPELLPPDHDQITQQTEEILGPYEVHDFFLYYWIRFGYSTKKIFWLACQSFSPKYSPSQLKHWLYIFVQRFISQQFKRSCMPDGPKVGAISLSPRADWRMPSDMDAQSFLDEINSLEFV